MTDSSQTENIWAAFAAAQAEFKPVVKNKINPAFHSKYADLQAILSAVAPALNAHGLALTQRAEMEGASIKIETILFHASGDSISSGVLVMPVPQGKNFVQSAGSAMTYARRYSLSAFLGVAADDDDDGNGAAPEKPEQPFVLTQAMVDAALAAAANGVAAYEAYYKSRPMQERTELAKSGWHKHCYKSAKAADAAKEAA